MSEKENQKAFVDLLSSCLSSSSCLYCFFSPSIFQCWANFELKSIFSLSLAVRFISCGQGGLVWFECSNPSDFRIEADGVVYAARALQHTVFPASALPLLIKASDTTTRQEWVTQVRLTSPKQVIMQTNHPVTF